MPGDLTELHLCRAMERGEFVLHYQPQFDLRSGAVTGVEALVRWEDPRRGRRDAAAFIPVFERRNLLGMLRGWVLDAAARQAARWCSHRARPRIWVNITAEALAARNDLPGVLRVVLDRHGLPGDALGLEFGGPLDVQRIDDAAATFGAVRDLGVDVALDHVGTGTATLAALRYLPVSVVKIERLFVAGLGRTRADTAVVGAITDLAHRLGLVVVGEGVEEAETLRWLRELGVDRAQGRFLAPPAPAGDEPPTPLDPALLPASAAG